MRFRTCYAYTSSILHSSTNLHYHQAHIRLSRARPMYRPSCTHPCCLVGMWSIRLNTHIFRRLPASRPGQGKLHTVKLVWNVRFASVNKTRFTNACQAFNHEYIMSFVGTPHYVKSFPIYGLLRVVYRLALWTPWVRIGTRLHYSIASGGRTSGMVFTVHRSFCTFRRGNNRIKIATNWIRRVGFVRRRECAIIFIAMKVYCNKVGRACMGIMRCRDNFVRRRFFRLLQKGLAQYVDSLL